MKKLTTLALALTTFAVGAQSVSQKSAKLAYGHQIAISQSFYWNGGFISEVSMPVFSRYHPTDHPAVIYIVSGVGTNPISGNVLFQKNVSFSSLNKFYAESFLSTLSVPQIESLWVDIQDSIDIDTLLFDDLKTTFEINQFFSADSMTIFLELDTSVNYLGYKYLTIFGNCFPNEGCPNPIPDPYEDGRMFFGFSGFNLSSDADLAFEFLSLGTGISNIDLTSLFTVYPNPSSGEFFVSTDIQIEYEVFDVLGSLVEGG